MEIDQEAAPENALASSYIKINDGNSKPMKAYERNRKNLIDRLAVYLAWHLHEPRRYAFHEIFFAAGSDIGDDYSAAKNRLVGAERAAVHATFDDSSFYLKCQYCCRCRQHRCIDVVKEEGSILRSMPDRQMMMMSRSRKRNLFGKSNRNYSIFHFRLNVGR